MSTGTIRRHRRDRALRESASGTEGVTTTEDVTSSAPEVEINEETGNRVNTDTVDASDQPAEESEGTVPEEAPEPGGDFGQDEGTQGIEAPAKSASKAEWVAFAIQRGADETTINDLTKAEIQDKYAPEA